MIMSMRFQSALLTLIVIFSLLARELEGYAIRPVARSLSGFSFPTVHHGPAPTLTGQVGSSAPKTTRVTIHVTITVSVSTSLVPVSRGTSSVVLKSSSMSKPVQAGTSSSVKSTGSILNTVSTVAGTETNVASKSTMHTTGSVAKGSGATTSSHTESRPSSMDPGTTTRPASVTTDYVLTSKAISLMPSATSTSAPVSPPSKSLDDEISTKIGIVFSAVVIFLALVFWVWLVALPKYRTRKTKLAMAKESESKQESETEKLNWWGRFRTVPKQPWVNVTWSLRSTGKELPFDSSTQPGSSQDDSPLKWPPVTRTQLPALHPSPSHRPEIIDRDDLPISEVASIGGWTDDGSEDVQVQ